MAFPALPRDERRQEPRGPPRACPDGDPAIKEPGRPVAWVIVQEGPAAGEGVLECGEADFSDRPGVDVVAAPYGQREAVAGRQHDARWPYLNSELVDLPGRERLRVVVGVERPIRA